MLSVVGNVPLNDQHIWITPPDNTFKYELNIQETIVYVSENSHAVLVKVAKC